MQTTTLSLRERQRLEVAAAIHDSAAELLLEHGWTATTVDMIATRAGVSSRTFFNYFPSKEDAALGFRELRMPPEALEAFRSSEADLLERTVQLTMAVFGTAFPGAELDARGKTLIRELPELRTRLKHFSAVAGDLIQPVLAAELGTMHAHGSPSDPAEDEAAATALRMLAGTVIRFAMAQDFAALSADPSAALAAAVSTFRKVIELSS